MRAKLGGISTKKYNRATLRSMLFVDNKPNTTFQLSFYANIMIKSDSVMREVSDRNRRKLNIE